ncbi:hypothetical protein Leryth_007986 [Lithospermum erythrorhizon]|nr:hypothetical protein Leryth_007986 [Lithospermum erythrorhizon]
MMNSSGSNGVISSSSANSNSQSPGLKTYFKTPEGKYKLQYEKTHPTGLLHYAHGKTVTQAKSSWVGGMRSAAAKFLGGGNGSKALSFVGGNGGTKSVSGTNGRVGSLGASSSSNLVGNSNFDGKGTYLIFNVGDTIFISDLNSRDKDPVKSIQFSGSNPVSHAFDPDAKDGNDLLIGLSSGDVYSASLRQQLQDVGKKLVGAQHYNKDGASDQITLCFSRCTSIAWVPNGDGTFIVGHADGNNKDGSSDPSFPIIKDQTQFSVTHARYSKASFVIAMDFESGMICFLGIQLLDGTYVKVQLTVSLFRRMGPILPLLAGMVSGVAFDSYWAAQNSDGTDENIVYRFGSVGQDTQLLLWDLEMDELVVPVRRAPGGSPTFTTGSQSSHWDTANLVGILQPARH